MVAHHVRHTHALNRCRTVIQPAVADPAVAVPTSQTQRRLMRGPVVELKNIMWSRVFS